jgi:hypothetical protein
MSLFPIVDGRARFDASSNADSDRYSAGIRFTQEGAARSMTSAGTFFNQGIPMSSTGQVALVDASSGLPANVVWLSGLPISNDRVCISNKPVSVVSSGIPYDSAGAVAATVAPITTNATLDLVFAGVSNDLLNPTSYTLTTDFITPQYQVGAQYTVWDNGLVQKNFADIVTFTRASTGTYFNSAGTLTTAAINEARFDFNPSTLAAQGLLIEESRTNSIRNNTMQGAVAGTPGTAPTNWTISTATGNLTTREIVGTGTENGIAYVDVRFVASGAFTASIYADSATGVAASNGQTWTTSFYVKLAGGSLTNVTVQTSIVENDSGGNFLVGADSATFVPTSAALSTQRFTQTRTNTNASTAFEWSRVRVNFTGAGDVTLRIGLPQLEQGAFATSVIPTTTTALTRSADVASVNTLSPWYNSVAGTLYAEWVARLGVDQQPFGLVNVADGVRIRKNAANNYGFVVREPTVRDLALVPSPALTEGQIIKVAGAYAANDIALSGGGQSPVAGPTYSVVTATTAFIGGSVSTGAPYVNGHLRRITYYPRRLSNAELQTITA